LAADQNPHLFLQFSKTTPDYNQDSFQLAILLEKTYDSGKKNLQKSPILIIGLLEKTYDSGKKNLQKSPILIIGTGREIKKRRKKTSDDVIKSDISMLRNTDFGLI
jgi:hypothetical protein